MLDAGLSNPPDIGSQQALARLSLAKEEEEEEEVFIKREYKERQAGRQAGKQTDRQPFKLFSLLLKSFHMDI